jgi:serine/threonine protein kinase
MSLVRYNTSNSELADTVSDNKTLTLVYRNKDSNEIVLYDASSNDFQIVKLNKPSENNTRRRSYPFEDSTNVKMKHSKLRRDKNINQNSKSFICSNCGAFNNVYSSSSSDLEDSDHLDNNLVLKNNKLLELNNKSFNSYDNFMETTHGDYIRNDYFKLLTTSMYKNDDTSNTNHNRTLLMDDESMESSSNYIFNTIPENMINQGYFEKFFKILSKLGTGSFGSVYKVEHELLGLNLGIFALKKIPIGDDVNNLRKILNEVKFLYDISCNIPDHNNNNVVKYNHVWVEIDQVSRFSPKIPVVFLLFEYCAGGTLEDWVDSIINPKISLLEEKVWRKLKIKNKNHLTSRNLNNFEIFKIFNDVTLGLNYLHDLRILHRDLKPSNCLFKTKFNDNYKFNPIKSLKDLDQIPTILVSDFGESIMVNSIEENWANIESTGNTGTLEFCAPEIIIGRKKSMFKNSKFGGFSYASDNYSLGMILYYLCFGKLPFSYINESDPQDISDEILSYGLFDNLYNIRPLISNLSFNEDDSEFDTNDQSSKDDGLLVDWIELIESLVDKEPNNRPSTKEVLSKLALIYDKLDLSRDEIIETDNAMQHQLEFKVVDGVENVTDVSIVNNKEKDFVDMVTAQVVEPINSPFRFRPRTAIMILMFILVVMMLKTMQQFDPLNLKLTSGINTQFLMIGLYFGGDSISDFTFKTEIVFAILVFVIYIIEFYYK